MSVSRTRPVNTGAYTTPFSNTGMEFFPLGILPDLSGLVLHESGYLPRNEHWNFPNIFSPFWRLIYDFRPGHKVLFEGKELKLGRGHIVLIPDHFRCHFHGPKPVPTFWLHFSYACRAPQAKTRPLELPPTATELRLVEELKAQFGPEDGERNRRRIFCLSLALLQVVLSRPDLHWLEELPQSLLCATRHIEKNFASALYNKDLARQAHLSLSGLSRLFKRHHGVSPAHFIAQVRVREAARLLADTTLSLEEIAERTGFPDRAYFSRVFKRITGEAPASFRHHHFPPS